MLSKEEIEKAKEKLKNLHPKIYWQRPDILTTKMKPDVKLEQTIETLLQYIDQLEQENNKLQDIIENKVHYIKCENCGIEMRVKRSDVKYCKKCSQKLWYKNLSADKKKQRAEKSKISMQKIRLARKDKINVK